MPNCCAISTNTHFVAPRFTFVFSFITAGVHFGFARLESSWYGVQVKHDLLLPEGSFGEFKLRHGPAICEEKFGYEILKHKIPNWTSVAAAHGVDAAMPVVECSDSSKSKDTFHKDIFTRDVVHCIRCPYWPSVAAEWVTRRRLHGWPAKYLLDKIVNAGCNFVAVGHKLTREKDTEFRFSFSEAENMLTASWSRGQRRCYRVLKAVNELVQQKSYYFKTLMFWSCDNRPSEFWNDQRLTNSVRELLICMSEWMNRKRCPNYFTSDNNMMNHIPDVINMEMEVKLVGEMYRQIDELVVGVDDNGSRYMKIKYPKWLVNTSKLIIHFISFDIHGKGCTLGRTKPIAILKDLFLNIQICITHYIHNFRCWMSHAPTSAVDLLRLRT